MTAQIPRQRFNYYLIWFDADHEVVGLDVFLKPEERESTLQFARDNGPPYKAFAYSEFDKEIIYPRKKY